MLSYLLLSVEKVMQKNIKDKLKTFEFTIEKVEERRGKYNIVARVVTDNQSCLQEFVDEHVGPLSGIKRMETITI